MRRLWEDHSIFIKPAAKGSCAVVWDSTDYLAEAESYLYDNIFYKENFGEKGLVKLVEQSSKML